jgi:nucleotide-binding universal stress UspA family protein
MRPIKTILVPTDFSAPAERALAYARSLADTYRASLHLLHVIEDPFAGGVHMGMVGAPPEGYFEQLDQRSRARLSALLTDEEKEKYSAVIATRMGYAATEILDYVRNHGAIDLIVIATAGHGAVSRMLMGSVTDKIVRTAPCPVLTVHPHDRKDVAEAPHVA